MFPRYGDLQLTATRQTRWERLTSPNLSDFQDVTREVTPLCLTSTGELAPLWREVDVVGIVLRISSQETGFQLVHLIDHRVNIVALKFWGGLKVDAHTFLLLICTCTYALMSCLLEM